MPQSSNWYASPGPGCNVSRAPAGDVPQSCVCSGNEFERLKSCAQIWLVAHHIPVNARLQFRHGSAKRSPQSVGKTGVWDRLAAEVRRSLFPQLDWPTATPGPVPGVPLSLSLALPAEVPGLRSRSTAGDCALHHALDDLCHFVGRGPDHSLAQQSQARDAVRPCHQKLHIDRVASDQRDAGRSQTSVFPQAITVSPFVRGTRSSIVMTCDLQWVARRCRRRTLRSRIYTIYHLAGHAGRSEW